MYLVDSEENHSDAYGCSLLSIAASDRSMGRRWPSENFGVDEEVPTCENEIAKSTPTWRLSTLVS